jgi:hypothetical protein
MADSRWQIADRIRRGEKNIANCPPEVDPPTYNLISVADKTKYKISEKFAIFSQRLIRP